MHRLLIVTTFLFLMILLNASCVSQRGKEMREQAYSRMDQVNAGLLNEQATTAFETGQLDKAMNLADQAVDRFPKGSAHHVIRGRILMELDRLAEAERSLLKAIELNEDEADALYFLGVVYERLSRDDLAHDHFIKASSMEPGKLQFLMASVECLMSQGQLEEAESLLKERFGGFEHNAALHHLHAQLMVMQGRADDASSSYEMASLLAPEDVDLLGEWARLQHRQGDHMGVLASLDELRQLHKVDPPVDLQLIEARSLATAGREFEARTIYLELIETYPDRLTMWHEFGWFSWEIEDWRSLDRCGQRLEAAGDPSIQARLFLAVTAREDDSLDEATEILRGILEDAPEDAMANALLAGVCLRQGNSAEAQKAREVAVKSAPTGTDGTRVTGILGNGP
ncbi:MAG: tetratricopeptide repeat protein [Planctomycetota bacterium]|nr:tetratricopeptide repeat protein [Planctomycetota bacterium]